MPFVESPPESCARCRGRIITAEQDCYNGRLPDYVCLSCGARYYVGPVPDFFAEEENRTRRRQPMMGKMMRL